MQHYKSALYYTNDHEWINFKYKPAMVGIPLLT